MTLKSRRKKDSKFTPRFIENQEVTETVGWVTPAIGGAYHPGTYKAFRGIERRRSVSKI